MKRNWLLWWQQHLRPKGGWEGLSTCEAWCFRESPAISKQQRLNFNEGWRVGIASLCGRAILAQEKGPQRGCKFPTHPSPFTIHEGGARMAHPYAQCWPMKRNWLLWWQQHLRPKGGWEGLSTCEAWCSKGLKVCSFSGSFHLIPTQQGMPLARARTRARMSAPE